VSAQTPPRAELLLALADDELVLGWRDSEWTGIAPMLEEDVAFSSIAQNEIGHARALYELAARELGGDADAIAFDRAPADYRCCPLVERRELDWGRTIARHYLYETADAIRMEALARSGWDELAGLARKIAREEAYHRLHAEMWVDRLAAQPPARARLADALADLWPYALGVLEGEQRAELRRRVAERLPFVDVARDEPPPDATRGAHSPELAELWEEMTMVRRTAPGAAW
jgi:ring-1,2-phenylacetyl-CoA epoxidase subunit PaaC